MVSLLSFLRVICPGLLLTFATFIPRSVLASARFHGLGDFSGGTFRSEAYGVSADGSAVVGFSHGSSGFEAFRWTQIDGMIGLGSLTGGPFHSEAYAISADGLVAVGLSRAAPATQEAFRWTQADGIMDLGNIGSGSSSSAHGVSADGSFVTGHINMSAPSTRAGFRWSTDGTSQPLGDLPGGTTFTQPNAISADGSVIVGTSDSGSGLEAFTWDTIKGIRSLNSITPDTFQGRTANALTSDASFVVGFGTNGLGDPEAFRWTQSSGFLTLGDLPGGDAFSRAFDVSDDGTIVVGDAFSKLGEEAFIWDEINGLRNLRNILSTDFQLDVGGWSLEVATGVSADGGTIVGFGTNPSGQREAWIAVIPEPRTAIVGFVGALLVFPLRRTYPIRLKRNHCLAS